METLRADLQRYLKILHRRSRLNEQQCHATRFQATIDTVGGALQLWRKSAASSPVLARVARWVLTVASRAASERTFSVLGDFLTKSRESLNIP